MWWMHELCPGTICASPFLSWQCLQTQWPCVECEILWTCMWHHASCTTIPLRASVPNLRHSKSHYRVARTCMTRMWRAWYEVATYPGKFYGYTILQNKHWTSLHCTPYSLWFIAEMQVTHSYIFSVIFYVPLGANGTDFLVVSLWMNWNENWILGYATNYSETAIYDHLLMRLHFLGMGQVSHSFNLFLIFPRQLPLPSSKDVAFLDQKYIETSKGAQFTAAEVSYQWHRNRGDQNGGQPE